VQLTGECASPQAASSRSRAASTPSAPILTDMRRFPHAVGIGVAFDLYLERRNRDALHGGAHGDGGGGTRGHPCAQQPAWVGAGSIAAQRLRHVSYGTLGPGT
jgi:hypothetical protein